MAPGIFEERAALATILLLHSVLKYQAASHAARMLAGKQRSGELELLLTTPFGEAEVLRGCLLELKRSLFWPTLFALGVEPALMVCGWREDWFGGGLGWTIALLGEVLWSLANLISLSWVGLFLGFRLANPARAAGQAIFYVVLLPWTVAIAFAALAGWPAGGRFGPGLVQRGDFCYCPRLLQFILHRPGRQRIALEFPLMGRANLRLRTRDCSIMDNLTVGPLPFTAWAASPAAPSPGARAWWNTSARKSPRRNRGPLQYRLRQTARRRHASRHRDAH